jgi:hypothetical protein
MSSVLHLMVFMTVIFFAQILPYEKAKLNELIRTDNKVNVAELYC